MVGTQYGGVRQEQESRSGIRVEGKRVIAVSQCSECEWESYASWIIGCKRCGGKMIKTEEVKQGSEEKGTDSTEPTAKYVRRRYG